MQPSQFPLSRALHAIGSLPLLAFFGAMLFATILTVSEAGAQCTPAASAGPPIAPVAGTTVTCAGATIDQNGNNGYGTGDQSGLTINVLTNATVTGIGAAGISLNDANTINNSGGISGFSTGVDAAGGLSIVNASSGTIFGNTYGILAGTGITLNNAGSVTSNTTGIFATTVNITNSGTISGPSAAIVATGSGAIYNSGNINASIAAIDIGTDAQVTNTAAGTIFSNSTALAAGASLTLNNAGSLTSTSTAVSAGTTASITNSGTISGANNFGISASGNVNLTNSGSISGLIFAIGSGANVTIANSASGTIFGNQAGVFAAGTINVGNAGSITSDINGIIAGASATVTNSGTISGDQSAISAATSATIVNSGTVQSLTYGIDVGTNATVTNTATGTIFGDSAGIITGITLSLNNAGSITGISNALNANSGDITNTGVLSAALAVRFNSGASTIFNAGQITGTGGTAIEFAGTGNTLTLGPGFAITGNVLGTGADTFQLGGSGTGTFNATLLGTQYTGFSTFNKVGMSTFALSGTGAQDWAVQGGTLLADGNFSGTFTVTGGVLGGTGTVGNASINNGTLAPGNNAPGTLNVSGNLVFTTAAQYLVQLAQATASLTSVAGTATLAGVVQVVSPTNSFAFNQSYTILTARGGLGGTQFNSLSLPNFITGALSYTPDDVYLTLSLAFEQAAGLNANQRAVASSIDRVGNANGALPAGFSALLNLPASALPGALTQLSGETATGSQQTTFDAMNQFMGLLTDPFTGGRGDGAATGTAAPGYAEQQGYDASAYAPRDGSQRARDAYAAIYRKAPALAPQFVPGWSVWAAGFGGSQTTDGNAALGSNTATSSIAGTAVGADYRLSPTTRAGFALAGGGTSFGIVGGGSGRSDLFQAGAFIRNNAGPAYVSAALAYGWQDITTNRTVSVAGTDQLRAEFNANAYSGRLEGGYRLVSPWLGGIGVTLYAGAQFTTFDLPGYAEQATAGSNAFALAYGARDVTDARSELGIRTDKSWALQGAILTLRSRFAWANDFDPDRSIAATFQTLPGASFVVNGAAQAHDSALTTASVEMKWINGWSAAATFEGEFSSVTSSYAGKGVVRYVW